MLLVADLANQNDAKKTTGKIIETLANGYLSESTQRELSNEYQHDRVQMVISKILRLCALAESSLSIGRVKHPCLFTVANFPFFFR